MINANIITYQIYNCTLVISSLVSSEKANVVEAITTLDGKLLEILLDNENALGG